MSKEVTLQSSKSGVPKSGETKLIAYASSYQDVVSGGSVSAPTAYFNVRVTVNQNAKLDYDFHVRKVIGTQNEYDNCDEDVIDGVVSTSENLKGWYFRVEVSNVSTFYRYYNVRSFILGPTDEAGRTQTIGEYVMEHFNYSNVSSLVPTDYYEVTELGRKVGSSYVMPDFYTPDRVTHSFLFSPGSTTQDKPVISECYYTNIFSIPLEIIKTTDDGSSPENYYFSITNQETGKSYTAHVNSNGTFCIRNQTRASDGRTYLKLPEGKYTLTELGLKQSGGGYAVPERFVEPQPIEFEITPDAYKQALESGYQAVTIRVDNKCEGKIRIRKTEEDGEQPVAGAVYGLFSDEDCLNLIYTFPETDGNGETETADKYPCGEQFYVKEIEAPASYELSDTIYKELVISFNEMNNIARCFCLKRLALVFIAVIILLSGCSASQSGFAASYTQITQEESMEMMKKDDGHIIVDVRRQDEYDEGHIPGAVLIPNESITDQQPKELPDLDQIILVYCRSGRRSKEASQKLADIGYTNVYEFGGIITWSGETVR